MDDISIANLHRWMSEQGFTGTESGLKNIIDDEIFASANRDKKGLLINNINRTLNSHAKKTLLNLISSLEKHFDFVEYTYYSCEHSNSIVCGHRKPKYKHRPVMIATFYILIKPKTINIYGSLKGQSSNSEEMMELKDFDYTWANNNDQNEN